METDGCGLGDRLQGSGRCHPHTQTHKHTLVANAQCTHSRVITPAPPGTHNWAPQTHKGLASQHRPAQNTHIRRPTHETHNHTLPRPCAHTYTLIHRRQARAPHLGLHTQTCTHSFTHTPDNGQSPAELDMHTRRTHVQAFTHLLHSDTPGDCVETRTHLGINTHSRHSTMSVYTRTYAHTPHPTRSHTNTPRPSRTCSCGHTHAVALTHTWMPTRTPTHTHAANTPRQAPA